MVSVRLKKLAGEAPGEKSNQPRREMQVKCCAGMKALMLPSGKSF
jgi:hypothetical protein